MKPIVFIVLLLSIIAHVFLILIRHRAPEGFQDEFYFILGITVLLSVLFGHELSRHRAEGK